MKIAASDFLNAKPLIYDIEKKVGDIFWGSPKDCAKVLENKEADVALLPSIEYARIPHLFILPGVSISSVGPVQSVMLFLRKDIKSVQSIAVDERSRTAAILLKILAKESLKIEAEYVEKPASLEDMLKHHDAALLIGDQALVGEKQFKGERVDLGEAWYDLTHLPFTYAFWAGRKEENLDLLLPLLEAKEEGFLRCDQIAREAEQMFVKTGKIFISESFILDYLTKSICYEWSKSHEDGLRLFYQWAFFYGLIERVPELKFYDIEAYHL
ncbi:MAG: menaquinone biosynthesis protein [Chlamydiae bacterium]|nr:menaquinone biosynthesis protein [Chlamydiota bacterium]